MTLKSSRMKSREVAVTKMILGCKKKSKSKGGILTSLLQKTLLYYATSGSWVPYPFNLESSNIQSCMTLFSRHRGIISLSSAHPFPTPPPLAICLVASVRRQACIVDVKRCCVSFLLEKVTQVKHMKGWKQGAQKMVMTLTNFRVTEGERAKNTFVDGKIA